MTYEELEQRSDDELRDMIAAAQTILGAYLAAEISAEIQAFVSHRREKYHGKSR